MVRPSRRREMAIKAVQDKGLSIRVACVAFRISKSCYRYERKMNEENDEIANWLLRLTDNHRNWGFGLCYLYLRNVKGFGWNHKRVYRIYKELELNLRIKPRKRLVNNKFSVTQVHDLRVDCAVGRQQLSALRGRERGKCGVVCVRWTYSHSNVTQLLRKVETAWGTLYLT